MRQSNEPRGIRRKAYAIGVGVCILFLTASLIVAPRSSYAQCTANAVTFTTCPGVNKFVDKTFRMLTMGLRTGLCTVAVRTLPAFCGRVSSAIL